MANEPRQDRPSGPPARTTGQPPAEQKAKQSVDRAAESAQSTIHDTKSQISDRMQSVATAIQKAGEHLRQQNGPLAEPAERISRKLEDGARYVRERTPRELADDLSDLAQRRPGWFLGSAFLLGLVASRFLKSSSERAGARPNYSRGR